MIKLEVYHPDLVSISDRSVREVLKYTSKALRAASFREVTDILRECDLSRRERQSILDRIGPKIAEGPTFYVEKIDKGSIDIKATAAAFALFMLASTAGETVKEAWKEGEIHKRIVNYVSEERDDKFAEQIEEICRYDRNDWGRFFVRTVEVSDGVDGPIIRIILDTYEGEGPEISDEVNEEFVREYSERAIDRLRLTGDQK